MKRIVTAVIALGLFIGALPVAGLASVEDHERRIQDRMTTGPVEETFTETKALAPTPQAASSTEDAWSKRVKELYKLYKLHNL